MIVALVFLLGVITFTVNLTYIITTCNSFSITLLCVDLLSNETYSCCIHWQEYVNYTTVEYYNRVVSQCSNLLGSLLFLNTLNYAAIFTAVKFLSAIALLIFARGGIPRFRFDYLTKLGWIRFLSLVLLSIAVEILLLSLF